MHISSLAIHWFVYGEAFSLKQRLRKVLKKRLVDRGYQRNLKEEKLPSEINKLAETGSPRSWNKTARTKKKFQPNTSP